MASRKEQKEQARAARLAKEQDAAAKAQRTRRLQMFGGAIAIAVIVIVVAIVVSTGGGGGPKRRSRPQSATPRAAASEHVDTLLAGIPESDNTLGNPKAKVTITVLRRPRVPVCDGCHTRQSSPTSSTAGGRDRTTSRSSIVRTGKAKLVFKSLRRPQGQPRPERVQLSSRWPPTPPAFRARLVLHRADVQPAGAGGHRLRRPSATYQGIAKQIPGLNFKKWHADRNVSSLKAQITAEDQQGNAVDHGRRSTPTRRGQRASRAERYNPIVGLQAGYSRT